MVILHNKQTNKKMKTYKKLIYGMDRPKKGDFVSWGEKSTGWSTYSEGIITSVLDNPYNLVGVLVEARNKNGRSCSIWIK